jgi:hypothetical protein
MSCQFLRAGGLGGLASTHRCFPSYAWAATIVLCGDRGQYVHATASTAGHACSFPRIGTTGAALKYLLMSAFEFWGVTGGVFLPSLPSLPGRYWHQFKLFRTSQPL